MELNIPIKLLSGMAKLPTKSYSDDAAWDLYSAEVGMIPPGATQKIQTDISMEIPAGWCGIIKSRSGLGSRGLDCTGGVIDSRYRGNIGVLLINTSNEPFHYKVGDRVGQMLVLPVPIINWQVTEILSETDRGAGGFGSTGR